MPVHHMLIEESSPGDLMCTTPQYQISHMYTTFPCFITEHYTSKPIADQSKWQGNLDMASDQYGYLLIAELA